jgi:hypothetical protein
MASTTTNFDSLPVEVLLQIIIRVPYSPDDFKALTLVSRRVNQVMVKRGWKIFDDIAALQFPLAVEMTKYPSHWPFGKDVEFSTPSRLSVACTFYNSVQSELQLMQEVVQLMSDQGVGRKYVGVKGWKRNVMTGISFLARIQEYFCKAAGSPATSHTMDLMERKSRCRHIVASLPLSYCLTVRHTTLIVLELVNFLDNFRDVHFRLLNFFDNQDPVQPLSDTSMKFTLENNLSTRSEILAALNAYDGSRTEATQLKPWERIAFEIRYAQSLDVTELEDTFLRYGVRIDHLITQRIEDAIQNWDAFAEGEGKSFVEDMHAINGGDKDQARAARALIESFLDDLTGF